MIARFLLAVAAFVALLTVALLFLAWRAEPVMSLESALSTLPVSERDALTAIATSGGFKLSSLRPLGGYSFGLLDNTQNRRAIFIKAGHVRALRINAWPVSVPYVCFR